MSLSTQFISGMRTLVRTLGQQIQFSRTVGQDFVPSTGAVSGGTDSTYSAYGVVLNPTGDEELKDKTIEQFDYFVWLEVNSSATAPIIGDIATIGTTDYRVLTVLAYIINDTDFLYKLLVRI